MLWGIQERASNLISEIFMLGINDAFFIYMAIILHNPWSLSFINCFSKIMIQLYKSKGREKLNNILVYFQKHNWQLSLKMRMFTKYTVQLWIKKQERKWENTSLFWVQKFPVLMLFIYYALFNKFLNFTSLYSNSFLPHAHWMPY